MPSVHLISLGCPKNQVNSEKTLGALLGLGLRRADDPAHADYIIVNTCGFIQPAKQESIDEILQAAAYRKKGKLKKLVVTGCLSGRYAEELPGSLPEVDAFLGVNQTERLVRIFRRWEPELKPPRRNLPRPPLEKAGYSYLKISEGCSRGCTFCAIPLILGRFHSRPIPDIVREAREQERQGYRELILVAQELTGYGRDLRGPAKLAVLLEELLQKTGFPWIRLMYAHPRGFPLEILDLMAAERRLLPYLDLPLQHIADPLLKRMGRGITRAKTEALIGRMRATVPGLCLRTTFLLGFPGETEKHHRELLRFVEEARFDRLGCFGYSPEEGTAAFGFKNRPSDKITRRRQEELMNLQAGISAEINQSQVGRILDVLVEEKVDRGFSLGRSYRDAPEIDGLVKIHGVAPVPGRIVPVRITGSDTHDLSGILQ